MSKRNNSKRKCNDQINLEVKIGIYKLYTKFVINIINFFTFKN